MASSYRIVGLVVGLAACAPADPCADAGTMCVVAGVPGMGGNDADGQPADGSRLSYPLDVATDAEGRVLVLDWGNHRLRRVEADGTLRTVLGGEGGSALDAPAHLAFDPRDARRVVIADWSGNRLVSADLGAGESHTLGGRGVAGFAGDGGVVADAVFSGPSSVAFDQDGTLFVADQFNHVIRRVDPSGVVSTLAGQPGQPGWSGDGGPASLATLGAASSGEAPYPALRLHLVERTLYVADARNHVVRAIGLEDGLIRTVAGTGTAGVGADGLAATATALDGPTDLASGPAGELYIADAYNHCVRRLDADLTLHVVAGTCGMAGGRGVTVSDAHGLMYEPYGIEFDAVGGRLLVADKGNDAVRALALDVGTETTR